MDWDKASLELGKKLDKAHVKSANGVRGDFIEGWHAIAEANRIFGFNGWSYSVDTLTETWRGEVTLKSNRGEEYQQARAAYMAIVTVTVDGVTRQDVGNGSGSGHPNIWGDVIESAQKEAVTDALKRALRTFGNPFGLALYDKSRANVGTPDSEIPPKKPKAKTGATTISHEQFHEISDLLERLGDESEETKKKILYGYKINSLTELPSAKFLAVTSRLREMELSQSQEAANAA